MPTWRACIGTTKPTAGHRWSIGVIDVGLTLRGVAIAGRPVARGLDDGMTLEILRVCTDGTPNACSALYGACRRIAKEFGHPKVITYTLDSESGISLRAAGWQSDGTIRGHSWNSPGRPRIDKAPTCDKQRWSCTAALPHGWLFQTGSVVEPTSAELAFA